MIIVCGDGGGIKLPCWWTEGLQHVANDTNLSLHVHHFPHGTTKSDSIIGRRVYWITRNWRGFPMIKYAAVICKVASMEGCNYSARGSPIDTSELEAEYDAINKRSAQRRSTHSEFREQWNYLIRPER
jgi:hypothetical protein